MKGHEGQKGKAANTFWTALALLVALACAAIFVSRLVLDSSSRSWPTTGGVITESGISVDTDSEGDTSYQVSVAYQYIVDDVAYVGDRVSSLRAISRGSLQAAEEQWEKYLPGSEVTVFFDPKNPHRAVLETGTRWGDWLGLLGSVVGAAICARLLVRATKDRKTEPDRSE
jgi:hypothetical protein